MSPSTSPNLVVASLGPDLIREIIDKLSPAELIQGRQLGKGIKDYIDTAAPLQYSILKNRLGIDRIETQDELTDVHKLEKLRQVEEAQATLSYGLTPSKRLHWSIPDWPAFVPGLLATAGKFFYTSDWDAREQRARHIKRYALEKAADSSKPEIFEMENAFSSWAVDVAQGVLLVFWTDTHSPWENPTCNSRISILNLWTLKPLSPKHHSILLAVTPGAQYHHRLSIRGDVIAIAYLKGTFPERSDTGEALIYNWKTGARSCIHVLPGEQIKSAEILSDTALLVSVSTEYSKHMQLRLFAIPKDLSTDPIQFVATYDLPRLHQFLWANDIILRSSPASLACADAKQVDEDEEEDMSMEVDGEEANLEEPKRSQTRMSNGHGIVHVTMKLAGFLMWEDGTIGREWVGTLTGCLLIPPLHEAASAALTVKANDKEIPATPFRPSFHLWETWANNNFHWMPSHYRPTQQSLCGYRILVPHPQRRSPPLIGAPASLIPPTRMVNLVMYDFNPRTVRKYLSERSRGIDVEIPLSTSSSKSGNNKIMDTKVTESMSPVENEDMIFASGQDTNGGLQCLTVKQLRSCAVDACAGFIDHDRIVLQTIVDDGPAPHERHLDIQVLQMEEKKMTKEIV